MLRFIDSISLSVYLKLIWILSAFDLAANSLVWFIKVSSKMASISSQTFINSNIIPFDGPIKCHIPPFRFIRPFWIESLASRIIDSINLRNYFGSPRKVCIRVFLLLLLHVGCHMWFWRYCTNHNFDLKNKTINSALISPSLSIHIKQLNTSDRTETSRCSLSFSSIR